jgi:SAM-dependent methyltransferase
VAVHTRNPVAPLESAMRSSFEAINSSKANFDDIYSMDDPRGYFSVLGALDYMIPDLAAPIVRQVLAARARDCGYGRAPLILDVGCSYGINAAVHRFPLTFAVLRRRYTRREVARLSSSELLRFDRSYYASWPDVGLGTFIGLDPSAPAIAYAKRVGLIEAGITTNLETSDPTQADARLLEDTDVILSTGAVGYVTEKTYRRILGSARRKPWIVSFVLRMFPYDSFAALFAEHGLVTERLASAVFVQRRFRDIAEFEGTLQTLKERGVQTDGFESDGLLRAELYISRPAADAWTMPIDDLVTVCSGLNRPVGTRYVKITEDEAEVALEQ